MRDSQDGSHQYHSSRRHGSNVYHQRESDRHYNNDFAHAPPSDQIGSPGSARRRSLLLTSPQLSISQSPSGSRPLRIQPEGSAHHRSYSRHDENSDADLSSNFGNFGLTEQEELYNRQSHPFNSGEVDECDKYNPLVIHHARRQSIIQPHALSSWHNGHLSQSPRMSDDHRVREDHVTHEPPQRKQGLRYHQGLWQMTGKSGAVVPKATTSPASTTMSKTSAHAIISPSSSRSSSSSTVISPLSPGFSRDGRGFYESQSSEAQETQQGNSTNCRKSFPTESSMNSDSVARRRSCTVAAPPTLLNSIFQRVRNPQDCLPLGMRSPLSLTDDDLKTFGMSDSQLVKHQTKQDWSQGRADRSASVAGIPLSHPSSSSMVTGNSVPNGYRDRRRASNGTEEGYQARDRFSGRFIHQVTFSLDESHKSGLQAILVLRKLTNGLTSTIQKSASPVHPSRSSPPSIPIPRISHRYPEHSTPTTVLVNGRPQTVLVQKIIPSVVIDWSDGARDQFDPTGMSLQEILDRCHFRPSSST